MNFEEGKERSIKKKTKEIRPMENREIERAKNRKWCYKNIKKQNNGRT